MRGSKGSLVCKCDQRAKDHNTLDEVSKEIIKIKARQPAGFLSRSKKEYIDLIFCSQTDGDHEVNDMNFNGR